MEVNLREKGTMVQALWDSVNETTGNLSIVPGLIHSVLKTGAWQERIHRGKTYHNDSFLAFITNKPMQGCGWPPEKVEVLLHDDPVILAEWREATTRPSHRPSESADNVSTLQPKHGNSLAYTLQRLKQQEPELFKRVTRGELSAHAAAIQAGFRKKLSVLDQIRRLLPKLNPEQLATLAGELSGLMTEERVILHRETSASTSGN
jgi:hypothetical protein